MAASKLQQANIDRTELYDQVDLHFKKPDHFLAHVHLFEFFVYAIPQFRLALSVSFAYPIMEFRYYGSAGCLVPE